MNEYIATFYSHFGAIRFKRMCEAKGWQVKVMPVPRNLSSSCGTCVFWKGDLPDAFSEEVEQTVIIETAGYRVVYRAKNS